VLFLHNLICTDLNETLIFFTGDLVEMSLREEQLLADGRNFMHSAGSVHASELDLLFRYKERIEQAQDELSGPKKVGFVVMFML